MNMTSQSATREQFPLSKKKIIKKTILGSIGWIVLLVVLDGGLIWFSKALLSSGNQIFGQVLSLSRSVTVWVILLLLVMIVVELIYQVLYFNAYFYDFTDSFIVIRKGVITPKEISIPYERVQDVYMDQDIWDRIFGIYDVHLSTATSTSGMQAHIDGVEKSAADGLKLTLLKTIDTKIHTKASPVIPTFPNEQSK